MLPAGETSDISEYFLLDSVFTTADLKNDISRYDIRVTQR